MDEITGNKMFTKKQFEEMGNGLSDWRGDYEKFKLNLRQ
jgi:hypothetical protein